MKTYRYTRFIRGEFIQNSFWGVYKVVDIVNAQHYVIQRITDKVEIRFSIYIIDSKIGNWYIVDKHSIYWKYVKDLL